jgi:hypothetical protein
MFRCPEISQVDYEAASPPVRKNQEQRKRFGKTGRGYVEIQSTKVIAPVLRIMTRIELYTSHSLLDTPSARLLLPY